jgi:undecaprenyl-diphosphatase
MTLPQALFLGALQGVAELFPVSSLAQTIILPALLGWDLGNQESADFLSFVVALHLATAAALFIYFWKDWKAVIVGFIGGIRKGKLIHDAASKFAWLLIAGTVVVGFIGLVFEKKLRMLFDDPKKAWVVAGILVVNGIFMLLADALKRRAGRVSGDAAPEAAPGSDDPAKDAAQERRKAEDLTLIEGASIGAMQTLALLPGISRSGFTIAAGLLAGLSYEQASRFSFMLATPVIGLAAALKVPKLFSPAARPMLAVTIPSAILAGVCAYLSTRFLMKYFRHHRLGPFAWYCIIFGIFALIMLKRGV